MKLERVYFRNPFTSPEQWHQNSHQNRHHSHYSVGTKYKKWKHACRFCCCCCCCFIVTVSLAASYVLVHSYEIKTGFSVTVGFWGAYSY